VRSLTVATIGGGAATLLATGGGGGAIVIPGNQRLRELDSELGAWGIVRLRLRATDST
jgi:hypothetical protein